MTFFNDMRLALRTWRGTPALGAIVILTLAIGIGATTTAFALAYSILVRPLPFPEPERLVLISSYNTQTSDGSAAGYGGNRMSQFLDWQEHATAFEQLGAWGGSSQSTYALTGSGRPDLVGGLDVTEPLLTMLGARPIAGRLFREGEDAPGAAPVVVLAHGFWQRRFGGRADIVGDPIVVNGVVRTIVGVVSHDFRLRGTLLPESSIDIYVPFIRDARADQFGFFMTVLGRLRPGVTVEQARADLAARQAVLAAAPERSFMRIFAPHVAPLSEPVTRDARVPLLLLLGGVGCVLMIACANLANLLLVRASARRQEMQVRAALGATLRKILRQTLAEHVLLAATGSALGIGFAAATMRVLRSASWLDLPRLAEVTITGETLAFVATVCTLTTLVFGSLPLLHVRRRDLADALRPHGAITPDRRTAHIQRVALVMQVAFALMLTVAGTLLFRSFIGLSSVDPGFNPDRVVAMRADPGNRLDPDARVPFFNAMIDRVSGLAGVESAAVAINLPMDRNMSWDLAIPGQPFRPGTDVAWARIVSHGYFRTVGIRMLRGRDFESRDQLDAPLVVAINETLARRLAGVGQEPLAATLTVSGRARQVIAVVSDVKHETLALGAGPEIYIPHAQAPGFTAYDLVVRASGNPELIVAALREAIWAEDASQAVGAPVLMQSLVSRTLIPHRLLTWLLGGFATTALLLAALGVYGIVGYRVAQRTKEIAIRVAFGAPRWQITSGVLRDALMFVGLGLVVGVPLALGAGQAVSAYLFGVEPRDLGTLVTACAAVLLAALIAAYVPARRAPRIDPLASLRAE